MINARKYYPVFLFCRDKIVKAIKAKDQYGPVIPIVEKKNRELASQGLLPSHEDGEDHEGDADVNSSKPAANGSDKSLVLHR